MHIYSIQVLQMHAIVYLWPEFLFSEIFWSVHRKDKRRKCPWINILRSILHDQSVFLSTPDASVSCCVRIILVAFPVFDWHKNIAQGIADFRHRWGRHCRTHTAHLTSYFAINAAQIYGIFLQFDRNICFWHMYDNNMHWILQLVVF